MQLVKFSIPASITFARSTSERVIRFDTQDTWVLTNHQRDTLAATEFGKSMRAALLESRIQPFLVDRAGGCGRKLLFYACAGGYGDQLMAVPVAKILHDSGYKVSIAVETGADQLWWHQPFIQSIVIVPFKSSVLDEFDAVAAYESVTNHDCLPGQRHPTDNLLWRMGIPPEHVGVKTIKPVITVNERLAAKRIVQARNGRTAIYQVAASSKLRSLTPAMSREVLLRLATQHPDVQWIATVDKFLDPEYKTQLAGLPANVVPTNFASLRHLMAVAEQSEFGIGPDSFNSHLFGQLGLPFIGYHGAFDPALRARYYPQHQVWYYPAACTLAPCMHCYTGMPAGCPSKSAYCKLTEGDQALIEWICSKAKNLLEKP